MNLRSSAVLFALAAAALVFVGCAAGDERFTAEAPAGFWYGLWHGIIVVVAFIISLFSDTVNIYELNNSGGWYDFGFVLGIVLIGGGTFTARGRKPRGHNEAEWEAIGEKVERKVMRKLEEFAEAGEAADGTAEAGGADPEADPEWEEIGRKIEKKIKRKLKQWAEEE